MKLTTNVWDEEDNPHELEIDTNGEDIIGVCVMGRELWMWVSDARELAAALGSTLNVQARIDLERDQHCTNETLRTP